MKPALLISCLLIIITLIPYAQTGSFSFVNYDDPEYVYENPVMSSGISLRSIAWTFSIGNSANWHPVTWMSHLADSTIFGMNAGAHHLMNVLLHIANTLLLFFLLFMVTGFRWRSGFVAALFALHPMHVESVAWISERKDVLCTLFFLLTLLCYIRYTRKRSIQRYIPVILLFLLGLMAKPMLVTVPLIFILLDMWQRSETTPERFFLSSIKRLQEKIPFFCIAAASGIITIIAQHTKLAIASTSATYSLSFRLENALESYCAYIGKLLLPIHLAVFYPPRIHSSFTVILLCAVVFLTISYAALKYYKKYSYITFGWLWYCITLLPVIGIIQVGDQSMADRYTYIPSIGLFIIVAWGLYDIALHYRRFGLTVVVGVAITILALCGWLTCKQVGYWQNSQTLFEHALSVTTDNYVAHNNLGLYYAGQGNVSAALDQYQEAIRIHDSDVNAQNNLGNMLMEIGRIDAAIPHYEKAIVYKPGFAEAHNNLGIAFAQQNMLQEAIREFKETLRINPNNARPYNNIGLALIKLNENAAAIPYLLHAVELDAGNAEAHYNLGCAYVHCGDSLNAIPHFEAAQRIDAEYSRKP
jgi:Tfp pilus assembly protein PilF